jgi:hypothetical protein
LGESLAAELSKSSSHPVVVFHEYDQSAWGFTVYRTGDVIARFWNRPNVVEVDPESCRVSADSIADVFAVESRVVASYLRHFDTSEEPGKAWDDDEYTLGDHWVRCDFMKRLGMHYPDPGTPGTRYILIPETGINTPLR